MTIKIEAVSWKQRRVKVAGKWFDVYPGLNLKQLRVGVEQEVETVMGLYGEPVIKRVIKP